MSMLPFIKYKLEQQPDINGGSLFYKLGQTN